MTDQDTIPRAEQKGEKLDNAALSAASEEYLDALPWKTTTVKEDGSIVRELSTGLVHVVSPTELIVTSSPDGKVSYRLQEWDDLNLEEYAWSNDPKERVGTFSFNGGEGARRMKAADYTIASRLIERASKQFEGYAPKPAPTLKQRAASGFGSLLDKLYP